MKLQKQFGKKIGDKVYHKYVIVLPEELVRGADLEEGDELEGEASKHHISLKKRL